MSTLQNITVRPATLGDVPAITAIHIRSWQMTYAGYMADEHLANLSTDKRQAFWRDAIEYSEPQVVVAVASTKTGERVVGFAGFDRSRDAKTKPTTGEIWAVYVEPELIGQGVGLALWDATREGLIEEECTDVTVWLLLCSEQALHFYELAGFKREMNTLKTVEVGGVKLEEIRLKRSLN
ncbi:MAG: GNAT family N-acetyltransferase [Burkholderiaceae bacterium]|nr:GNAT family N-acetyltransferase [Burkholderiaceae bacterium]